MPSTIKLRTTLPLMLLAACAELGDRAQNGCPPGEACSPLTPDGLAFSGRSVSDAMFGLDDELYGTAVGGVQSIDLHDLATGRDLALPYVATTNTAGVSVAATDGNRVRLAAGAAGSGRLRISASDGLLMDRIDIRAAQVTEIGLSWPWISDAIGRRRPVKVWAGGRAYLVLALYDALGRRLVDESATIRLTGQVGDLDTYGWDTFELTSVPVGGTTVAIDVGGVSFAQAIDAVDTLDAVEVVDATRSDIQSGDSVSVCLVARSGEAHVHGAPWQFVSVGPAELTGADGGDGILDNCASVRTTAPGAVTVTATIGGLSASSQLTVVPRNRRAVRVIAPVDLEAVPAHVLGDRGR